MYPAGTSRPALYTAGGTSGSVQGYTNISLNLASHSMWNLGLTLQQETEARKGRAGYTPMLMHMHTSACNTHMHTCMLLSLPSWQPFVEGSWKWHVPSYQLYILPAHKFLLCLLNSVQLCCMMSHAFWKATEFSFLSLSPPTSPGVYNLLGLFVAFAMSPRCVGTSLVSSLHVISHWSLPWVVVP